MKQIYNEGRVVGLSAYDLYVRQFLSTYPEATPMTEKEWLSTSFSESTSMILRVPKGTSAGYHDYILPVNSNLSACTVVYGSLFQGQVTLSSDGYWATSVTDYGELISNTPDRHPVTPGQPEDVPAKLDITPIPDVVRRRSESFLMVTSGLVIQPGEWEDPVYLENPYTHDTGEDVPVDRKSLVPDFSQRAFVRLLIADTIGTDVYILLHGFADNTVVPGQAEFDRYHSSRKPENGDFLGPRVFPWSVPIVLLATTDTQSILDHTSKLLMSRVNYLGLFHTVTYETPIVTEDSQELLTEDGESIIVGKTGTVTEMWEQLGDSIIDAPYPTPV